VGSLIRVEVEPVRLEVSPGGPMAKVEVRVLNASSIVDEFVIAAIGTGNWLDATEARVRLFPDKDAEERIELGVPAGRFVTAGAREIGIRVSSVSDPSVSETTRLNVTVAGVAAEEQSLRLDPQVVRAGRSASLIATVTNTANFPLDLSLVGEDPERAVSFTLQPASLHVQPGARAAARVRVSAPRPFTGTERHRSITVKAEGGDAGLSAAGTFIQEPRITPLRLLMLRIFLTVGGAALMIVGALREWIAGQNGMTFTYDEYVLAAFDTEVTPVGDEIPQQLVSLGLVAVVLAAFVLLGLLGRTGKLTRFAGGFALILMAAVVGTLQFGGAAARGGLMLVLLGAFIALIGGLLGHFSKV